ncbi:MAG: hypothetical protein ACK40J_18060 [Rhodococcus sp. (in: high G+C Gram-positive bacteria)]
MQVARRVDELLTSDLSEAGVRCIVSNRAKSIDRLESKCRQREGKRIARGLNPYTTMDELASDIVDLAGVRVALYFPAQRHIVAGIVARRFNLLEAAKEFPVSGDVLRPGNPRFSGYAATHYRVNLRESDLAGSDRRYASARVEIQVASVFMHGWSEVEHDLVYKPDGQHLSEEEFAFLDQLNGLAISAEIALEGLQKANERRVSEQRRPFSDRYELATHLMELAKLSSDDPVASSGLGRIDLLFDLITSLGENTPEKIDRYLQSLHDDFDARPLAEQVIDALLAAEPERYKVLKQIRLRKSRKVEAGERTSELAAGALLASWIELEKLELELVPPVDMRSRIQPVGRRLAGGGYLNAEQVEQLDRLRRVRNAVVHGKGSVHVDEVLNAKSQIDSLVKHLRSRM